MFGFSHSNFYLGFINKYSHKFVKEISNESYLFYVVANINSKHMPFKIRKDQLFIKIKKSINCIKNSILTGAHKHPLREPYYGRVSFTQLCAHYGGPREQDL